LSPNHKQVVFSRELPNGSIQVGYVDTAGNHEHALNLHCTDPCVEVDDPTWSTDNEHIVSTRILGPFDPDTGSAASAVLWESDLSGHHLRRLSEAGIDGKFEDYRAQFGPGGWATFVRFRNSDGKSAIFRMKAAGGHAHQLTPWDIEAGLPDFSPAHSGPTVGLVVFETFTHGSPPGKTQAVGTVPADCQGISDCKSKLRLLTELNTNDEANYSPTWSPDGRTIAFGHATFDIIGDLWSMDSEGHHKKQLNDTPELEIWPDQGSTG
jgi:Tol biopolymer transport system component